MSHYKTLGVSEQATKAEIRAAFRKLAKKHHPDVNGGEMSETYTAIAKAYEVLADDDARALYDENGVSESSPNDLHDIAMMEIERMFLKVMEAVPAQTLQRTDIILVMRKLTDENLKSQQDCLDQSQNKLQDALEKRGILEARIKSTHKPRPVMFLEFYDKEIARIQKEIAVISDATAVLNMIMILLNGYKFEVAKEKAEAEKARKLEMKREGFRFTGGMC